MYAECRQNVCRMYAECMQNVCRIYAECMQNAGRMYAEYMQKGFTLIRFSRILIQVPSGIFETLGEIFSESG